MATWSDHDLAVNGTMIHYYRMGTPGKPPVALLHGYTDMGLCWLRLADDLAPDYDLVMIDAVGHGQSGLPPSGGYRGRAASDVLAVIAAIGLDRPALIGHSMGAATAARVAADAPDRIRAVVLEDPGWRDTVAPAPTAGAATAEGSRAPLGSPQWVAWIRSVKEMTADERHAMARAERPTWAERDRTYWADAKAQFNLGVIEDRAQTQAPPWRDVARRITAPVLLLTADPERGAIITPAQAAEAAGLWRTGRIVHIPGAGHNIRREQYAPFRDAVTAFLHETATA